MSIFSGNQGKNQQVFDHLKQPKCANFSLQRACLTHDVLLKRFGKEMFRLLTAAQGDIGTNPRNSKKPNRRNSEHSHKKKNLLIFHVLIDGGQPCIFVVIFAL